MRHHFFAPGVLMISGYSKIVNILPTYFHLLNQKSMLKAILSYNNNVSIVAISLY